jgi:hypothetical protein
MKAIKIILAIAVTGVIGFFVVRWIVNIEPPIEPPKPTNQFIDRIEREIDSLSKLSDDRFCKKFYQEINYHIDDGHKNQNFGETQSENDQWKENLSKSLYSAYAGKFIEQAFHVFSGADWDVHDLQFIRSEYRTLKNSSSLEKDSPVDQKFNEIQQIFSRYDEIVQFIDDCGKLSYSSYELSDRFPIQEVQNRISTANEYRNRSLGNAYVNRCSRLHNELQNVPQTLFTAHIKYLKNKVQIWSGLYSNYTTQSDYASKVYNPLKVEINLLDNDIYKVTNFNTEYAQLINKLNTDSHKAYNYFSSKN